MFHVKQLEQQIFPAHDLLNQYVALVKKWQKAVNLVSNKELNSLWERHILDSAQLYFEINKNAKILVDLGSGGGFPAVVVAILNKVLNGGLQRIILIESDNKKTVFLKEVSRVLALNLEVLNARIEEINDIKADIISSRALGSVALLLNLGASFYKSDTTYLLLKGESVDLELKEVPFLFKKEKITSKTNKNGCILKITEVEYL